jgi:hypothetical protein
VAAVVGAAAAELANSICPTSQMAPDEDREQEVVVRVGEVEAEEVVAGKIEALVSQMVLPRTLELPRARPHRTLLRKN